MPLRTANITFDEEAIGRSEAESISYLKAEATGSWSDRRSARSLVKLMGPDGQASHLLDVRYTVTAPRMFDRLMPSFDAADLSGLAETITVDQAVIEDCDGGGVVVDCGPIPVDM